MPQSRGRGDTGLVSTVVDLVLVLVLMPVAGYALIGGMRAARRVAEMRRKAPPPVPVDRIEANLRRLRAELDQTETSAELTAKRFHVRSVRGAYLDTLAEVLFQLGKKDEAVATQKKVVALAPRNAYFRKQLRRIEAGDHKVPRPANDDE